MRKCDGRRFGIIGILFCMACSTGAPQLDVVRIDPPTTKATSERDKPKGIEEDAMKIELFSLFPPQVHYKIAQMALAKTDPKILLRDAQNTICNGKNSRFISSYKVRLIIPKTQGVALDVASKSRQEIIKAARLYLKEHFFNTAIESQRNSNGDYQTINADFSAYKAAMHENGSDGFSDNWKLRNVSLDIPFVLSPSQKSIENFYAGIRYSETPNLDNSSFLNFSFFAIIIPKDRSAVLVPKVIPVLHEAWGRDNARDFQTSVNTTPICKDGIICGSYEHVSDTLYRYVYYIPSAYGWRLKDKGVLYPLHLAYMDDLAFFIKNYSFTVPKEDLIKVADHDQSGGVASNSFQYWGYEESYSDGGITPTLKFSPELAIKNNDYMWEHILASQTSIKESPQPDGSINYELGLSLQMFCSYGVPVNELTSK